MSPTSPVLTPPHRPTIGARLGAPALIVAAAAVMVGAGIAAGALLYSPPPIAIADDTRRVPAGVDLAALDSRDRALITRRLLACEDLRYGRITAEQYGAAIASIDASWTPPAPLPEPAIAWATTVRGFSTQYTETSWSASQALGAPDVYPQHGDIQKAWASLGSDDRDEWIEVGFDRANRLSALEIYETFNPGAVSRVDLIAEDGRTITAFTAEPEARGEASFRRRVDLGCTDDAIVAVRVHVASTAVAGWNEIDAIGAVPCAR
jgi:hypothetical protein